MSLVHQMIDAALAANLSQNELKAWLVLFKQTLCYGKSNDACTIRRLAELAHVREDRMPKALAAVVDKGLFERDDHKRFNHSWSIPVELLATNPEGGIFAPTIPVNGNATRKMGEVLPVDGESTPKNGIDNNIPYNTKPTVITKTTTTPTPAKTFEDFVRDEYDRLPIDMEIMLYHDSRERRDFMLRVEEAMPYPNGIDQRKAAQVLDGLKPSLARCCLKLLAVAMHKGAVNSPMGWLYKTAQKARAGQLDTSSLSPIPERCQWHQLTNRPVVDQCDDPFRADLQHSVQQPAANTAVLRRMAQEVAAINQMEKLAGSLPAQMLENRAALMQQINEMKGLGVVL